MHSARGEVGGILPSVVLANRAITEYRRELAWAPCAPAARMVVDSCSKSVHHELVARHSIWLIAGLLMLAGCSAEGGGSDAFATPTSLSISSAPASTPPGVPPSSIGPSVGTGFSAETSTSARTSDEILVRFTMQGGIRGVSDQLVILDDGSLTVRRARPVVEQSGQLTVEELADLRRILRGAESPDLPEKKPAGGNDFYEYEVAYGDTKIHAEQGAVPAPLQPLIADLTAVVAKYGS